MISFAREKGWYEGEDKDFNFRDAYNPLDFSGARGCDARAWSAFNILCDGQFTYLDAEGNEVTTAADSYLNYVMGYDLNGEMPLFVKPSRKISMKDVADVMRDHFEGTPMDMTTDIGAGGNAVPYRWRPMTFTWEGKTYTNERAIATQQTGFWFVAQSRGYLPDEVGAVIWFGCDDANMTVFTPVYCCTNVVPQCYSRVDGADYITFSWRSAFWIMNWVANMVYPRYDVMIGDVRATQQSLEGTLATAQKGIESAALELYEKNADEAKAFLTRYTNSAAQSTIDAWRTLGEYLVVKYSDGVVRRTDAQGRFQRNDIGQPASPIRPGYPESFLKEYIKATGDRYKVVK